MIISPLLVTPLLMALMGSVVGNAINHDKADVYSIGLVNGKASKSQSDFLKSSGSLKVVDMDRSEAEKQIREHEIRAAVVLPTETDRLMADNRTVPIVALYDQGNETSTSALRRLSGMMASHGLKVVESRLKTHNLSPELAKPFEVKGTPIPAGGSAAFFVRSNVRVQDWPG